MEPISRVVPGGRESKYYDITYRPSQDNIKLNSNCASILSYLALMDTEKNEKRKDKLMRQFNMALTNCNTLEELSNFKSFMAQTAGMGGYAVEFYMEVVDKINTTGRKEAKEELHKPVSKLVNGTIESEYYKITYRPDEENSKLNIACSEMLPWLALMDIRKSDDTKTKLMEKFNDALLTCKTDDDFKHLNTFMYSMSQKGGYATEFYNEIMNKTTRYEQDRIKKEIEEKQELENEFSNRIKNANSDEKDEFLRKYNNIKNEYEEVKKSGIINDETVDNLLSCFLRLKSDIDILYRSLPKVDAINIEEEMDGYIQQLHNMEHLLEESRVWTM